MELHEWTHDRWKIRKLAADPTYRQTFDSLRTQLDSWIIKTKDHGPESEKIYDSDMAVYVGAGIAVFEKNFALMKKWTMEGK